MGRIDKAIERAELLRKQAEHELSASSSDIVILEEKHISAQGEISHKISEIQANDPCLICGNSDLDWLAESYRKLKTSLAELVTGSQFKNMLLVTSAVPEEGKTITSINLATTLAHEYDHTVLLIDADLRAPSIHHYLGLPDGPGLLQYLRKECTVGEALIHTDIPQLVVMPAGGVAENPVELFNSNRMMSLISELKNRYSDRYIIMDSAPILPFADSKVLSAEVDGVLLVFRERKITMQQVEEAVNQISREKILGVIFNAATSNTPRSEHYYYNKKRG